MAQSAVMSTLSRRTSLSAFRPNTRQAVGMALAQSSNDMLYDETTFFQNGGKDHCSSTPLHCPREAKTVRESRSNANDDANAPLVSGYVLAAPLAIRCSSYRCRRAVTANGGSVRSVSEKVSTVMVFSPSTRIEPAVLTSTTTLVAVCGCSASTRTPFTRMRTPHSTVAANSRFE